MTKNPGAEPTQRLFEVRLPYPDNPSRSRRVKLTTDQLRALQDGSQPAATRYGLPNCPLLKGLDDVAMADMIRRGRMRKFSGDSTVVSEGEYADSLYFIISGKMRSVTKDPSGHPWSFFDLAIDTSGGLCGTSALVSSNRLHTITTMEDTVAIEYRSEDFKALMLDHAQLGLNVALYFTAKLCLANQRFVEFSSSYAPQRLAMVLSAQAESNGEPTDDPGKVRITTPLTHEDLASMIGSTRESVVHAFKHLRNAVERKGRFYTVDLAELNSIRSDQ